MDSLTNIISLSAMKIRNVINCLHYNNLTIKSCQFEKCENLLMVAEHIIAVLFSYPEFHGRFVMRFLY